MKNNAVKYEWLRYPTSGFLAAIALGVADSVHCGVKPLGVIIFALRAGLIGLILGGLQASWTIINEKWRGQLPGVSALLLPCLPWAFFISDHLACTATLRSLLPYWLVVGGGTTIISASLLLTLKIHFRYINPKRSFWVSIGALHVIPFVLSCVRFADLHPPLSLTAAVFAWLSTQLATYQIAKVLSARALFISLATSTLLVSGSFIVPIGLEDSFVAADHGVVVRYLSKLGAQEKLPTATPLANSKSLIKKPASIMGEPPAPLPHLPGQSVVLISIDALRSDHLGCLGYKRAVTPNIDQLAKSSTVFTNAYSSSPASSLSIPSLQAGQHMESVLRTKAPLPATIADRLRAQGYATIGLFPSKVFSAGPSLMGAIKKTAFGFEKWQILKRDAVKDALTAAQFVLKEKRRPVYLWIHFYDPHLPYDCHDKPFGDNPMDCYDAEIQYVDRELGPLITQLQNDLNDPIIALTADHGEAFGEHGRLYHSTDLYEEQIRVPLIISLPHGKPKIINSPVSNVDLADTLIALVSKNPREAMSTGLLPLLAQSSHETSPVIAAIKNKRAIINKNHKLLCNDWPTGACALYDLQNDPNEKHNIAGQKPAIASTLKATLKQMDDEKLDLLKKSAPRAIILGRLKRPDAFNDLFELAKDATSSYAPEAARLLSMYRDRTLQDQFTALQNSVNKQVAAWAAVGAALIGRECDEDLLVEYLGEASILGRWASVALGLQGDARALKYLLSDLDPSDPQMNAESILALGHLGDKKAVAPLIDLLKIKQTRWAVIEALGIIGDKRALKPLKKCKINEPDSSNLPRYKRALKNIAETATHQP